MMRFLVNRDAAAPGAPYPGEFKALFSIERQDEARGAITSWAGYEPTPLVNLRSLGSELEVGELLYKDEGSRFGLGSFKAAGGGYAAGRALLRRLQELGVADSSATVAELHSGKLAAAAAGLTLVTATDGNHGRAVAWGASNFGARAKIYIHQHVSTAREAAIRTLGADVVRVSGNYDDSVRQAAADAKANGYLIVSDTSYDGNEQVAADVMQGYTVMLAEVLDEAASPTHVFVQAGVGALAAVVCAFFWARLGPDRPHLILVESEVADCLYKSAEQGRPVTVEGDHPTIMAGLACGEVSDIAWDILKVGADAFMTIDDDHARAAIRRLYYPSGSDPRIVAGESGAAGLAGLMAGAHSPEFRDALGLTADARVLVIGTERDTDPDSFAEIVRQRGEAAI